MPHVSYEYSGHNIDIDVDEDRNGRWHWSYRIDGECYTVGRNRPLKSYDSMLGEAKRIAEQEADQLSPPLQ